MQIELAICLPREAETVMLARTAIAETLLTFGVDTGCVDDIRLALSEACTNVIDHAGSDDEYEIQIHVDQDNCAIDVRNTGSGFDAAALEGVQPDPLSARGRGVAIMHAVMDHVGFHSEEESGTIVHLVRSLQFRPDSPIARMRRADPSSNG
jgi:serine/threonine-protein kinase RsbW